MSDEQKPTHIDLFSGIGGFALAARWAGFRTVAFCEIEPYAQRVLAKNFGAVVANAAELHRDGCRGDSEPNERQISEPRERGSAARIHGDIFGLNGRNYRGAALLTGGFPCQPFSVAGKRRGSADDRHLWPEMLRVIAEARPAWVLGENVPGIIAMELDNVLSDLEAIGYACRSFVIPACAVDARHRRDRLWVIGRDVSDAVDRGSQIRRASGDESLAGSERIRQTAGDDISASTQSGDVPYSDATGLGERRGSEPVQSEQSPAEHNCKTVANDDCRGRGASREGEVEAGSANIAIPRGECVSDTDSESARWPAVPRGECCEWITEPDVGRVAHGIPARVDRLRGLGNAIVPQVAFEILKAIREEIGGLS